MKDPRNPFLSTTVGGGVEVENPNGCDKVTSIKRLTPVSSNWQTQAHLHQHRGTSKRDSPDAVEVSKANGDAPTK